VTGASPCHLQVRKGDEHGYFAFGGSTVIVLFQPGAIRVCEGHARTYGGLDCLVDPGTLVQFDRDLADNSRMPVETLLKMGNRIGTSAARIRSNLGSPVPSYGTDLASLSLSPVRVRSGPNLHAQMMSRCGTACLIHFRVNASKLDPYAPATLESRMPGPPYTASLMILPPPQNRAQSPAGTPRHDRRGSSDFIQVCRCLRS
jgi:hypothetical protein